MAQRSADQIEFSVDAVAMMCQVAVPSIAVAVSVAEVALVHVQKFHQAMFVVVAHE